MSFSSNHINKAHDNFVRSVMADPRVSREFFEAHLPQEILEVTDLNTLVFQPTSHIDELRKEAIADLLFKTNISNEEAYLYLLVEHQSTAHRLMPFRVLKYVFHAIDKHLTNTQTNKLPLIYPIVIYHDTVAYPYTTDIRDLVDAPRHLVDAYFLQPFHLIDLGKIEDKILKKRTWSGVMEFVLKHIFARDMLPHLRNIISVLRELEQSGGQRVVSLVLQYMIDRGKFTNEKQLIELVKNELSPETGGVVMTLAEKLISKGMEKGIQQGLEKGIEQGMEKVAQRLLAENVEPAFIAKITGLDLRQIKKLNRVQS